MEQKKIFVFSHNYIALNWHDIVSEQLELLLRSGLYDRATQIFYCCYADNEFDFFKFYNLVKNKDVQKKITIVNHSVNDGEKETLVFMQRICKNFPDSHLLYYHTKGVTSKFKNNSLIEKNVVSWRKLMEFFNIEHWDKCIEKLSNHDVCGVLYRFWINPVLEAYYYAGNFWWTNSDYFNTLPSLENLDGALWCESIITSLPHRWFNFYPHYYSEQELYDRYYDPNEYRNCFDNYSQP